MTLKCVHVLYLVNIPEPVLYAIYTLAFSFDLRCESVTHNYIYVCVCVCVCVCACVCVCVCVCDYLWEN